MTESEYKESNEEVIDAYYQVYLFNLESGLITLDECEEFLEMMEEEEAYLECAGIFKAINNYRAVEEKRFSELWLAINDNTDC